tara:strand:- start:188 stop:619 length:432 start_codon:yes stop_codon:yes gene_type:complete
LKLQNPLVVGEGNLSDLSQVLSNGQYFLPNISNFPVIDSAVQEGNCVYGFQMTVSDSHAPNGKRLLEILECLGIDEKSKKKFFLVFVVPEGSQLKKQKIIWKKDLSKKEFVEDKVQQWKYVQKVEKFRKKINKNDILNSNNDI